MPIRLSPTVSPKEIWQVSLNDTEGHEQRGQRPALILSVHRQANVCMVIPLTSNQDTLRFPYSYGIDCSTTNGLTCRSVALIYQMRCLTSSRLLRKLGDIEPNHFQRIIALVKNYLNIS